MARVWGMVATVFTPDGELIDHDSQGRLVKHLVAAGCTALGVFGPIAEAETLSRAERQAIIATVRRAAPSVPLVIAIPPTRLDAPAAPEFDTESLPPGSALLLPCARRSARELIADAERWRASWGLDIALEDRPGPDRQVLPVPELVAAVSNGRIIAVKEEAPVSVERVRALREETAAVVLAGNGGAAALDELLAGAQGLVAGISRPHEIVALAHAWEQGDVDRAALIHARIAALIAFESHSARSVGIRKETWARQGVIASATVRRPGADWIPHLEPHLEMHHRLGGTLPRSTR
ncbi:dihydrodipicolinate synthase family protein [Microbacterium ureisolvens]|uniref:Dihydrodipicolinate synthase family protein n=1 Tax=Microbacterium ureisolvens TaxID=2781186 RepID=A0ABS7HZG4_9MICO|nr:dihydrodipicolinate synthase family protein [Microbacterium ureisolvens]MBW9110678.1 dihydrodipicolinate synthase family protein [Microbacterium ureisolvens]